jgi:hypothetical protein
MTDKIEIKEYVGDWKKVSIEEACDFYQKLSSQLKKMVFEYHFRGITEAEIKDKLKGVINENQNKEI